MAALSRFCSNRVWISIELQILQHLCARSIRLLLPLQLMRGKADSFEGDSEGASSRKQRMNVWKEVQVKTKTSHDLCMHFRRLVTYVSSRVVTIFRFLNWILLLKGFIKKKHTFGLESKSFWLLYKSHRKTQTRKEKLKKMMITINPNIPWLPQRLGNRRTSHHRFDAFKKTGSVKRS